MNYRLIKIIFESYQNRTGNFLMTKGNFTLKLKTLILFFLFNSPVMKSITFKLLDWFKITKFKLYFFSK